MQDANNYKIIIMIALYYINTLKSLFCRPTFTPQDTHNMCGFIYITSKWLFLGCPSVWLAPTPERLGKYAANCLL